MGQKRSSSFLTLYWFPEELDVSKQDWNEGGGDGTERTQVDDVTLKSLELRRIDGECGDVVGVVTLVNPDGDFGSPVDMTEPAVVGILPLT